MTYPRENYTVEGPGCKSKEARGSLAKARGQGGVDRFDSGRLDLIRRVQIQWLGLHAGAAKRVACADPSQNGPEPLDLDSTTLDARMRPGGGGRPMAVRLRRRRDGGLGAGVLQIPRGKHEDDDGLTGNPTASPRDGDDGALRRTAGDRSGASPASAHG
jgi:hypothetical protein